MSDNYAFGKVVALDFDAAIVKATAALKEQGFGVLSDIDVAATLKAKIGAEIPPYRILGACNPAFAHQALGLDPSLGLLLPCNVVVRQDEAGAVHVEFIDPDKMLSIVPDPRMSGIAAEVRSRLERACAAL